MKIGTTVRVVQPPPVQGAVVERRFNAADEVECLVEWSEGGQPVRGWFLATQLQEVATPAQEGEA